MCTLEKIALKWASSFPGRRRSLKRGAGLHHRSGRLVARPSRLSSSIHIDRLLGLWSPLAVRVGLCSPSVMWVTFNDGTCLLEDILGTVAYVKFGRLSGRHSNRDLRQAAITEMVRVISATAVRLSRPLGRRLFSRLSKCRAMRRTAGSLGRAEAHHCRLFSFRPDRAMNFRRADRCVLSFKYDRLQ
ncbi:hypothetical protein NL676_000017 [Syzygium grande]|nr:hypothetical protein NL676_000017 [Syzygium grande]